MIVYSNAKINIGLFVKDKRPDGYHNLESIFYPIRLNDIIEILPAEIDSFHSSGIKIDTADNLILSAIKLMRKNYSIPPLYVHIYKRIPLGAGLGGGSSNASFTLIALNSLFNLELSQSEMNEYALELGSDCPFFIHNCPAFVEGRGEIVKPTNFSLKGKYLKLIYPGFHSSTKLAFERLKKNSIANTIDIHSAHHLPSTLVNDFENGIFEIYPELDLIKKDLINEGAIYSSLTGTGSCVYGIFEDKPKSDNSHSWVFQLDF